MSPTFLCPTHRDWVYFNPQKALLYIEDSQKEGEVYLQQKNWQKASAFLGCAFEATEILMTLQQSQQSFLVRRLTSLAVLLSESFRQLNTLNISKLILCHAEQKLQDAAAKERDNHSRQDFIMQCIEKIKFYIEGFELNTVANDFPIQVH
ncbi:hypothetical protein RS130_08250 [Paraglaciecola aquimarina]|uniref:Uncharacterized protein n=1 Tax=Paraglaciecola aquimarina TaxID=1235557 RepID=A0ABU3SV93_9ALTE|nr:hypothetical protein [Paraglaciecola aquimarina]MDU0353919.1 hypothetical protein [Paraglaciecola aquimarina]